MRKLLILALALLPALPPLPTIAQTVAANGGRVAVDPATRRLSVRVVPGITSSKQLGNEVLEKARTALVQGAVIPIPLLRALADRQDGFAAYRLAEIVMRSEDPALAADAALYYSIAAGTGRGGALAGMIKAIDLIDPERTGAARLQVIKDMLLTYARAGNSRAVSAVLRYHLAEAPFGPMTEEVEALVLNAGDAASGPVALQMATALLQDRAPTRPDLEKAKAYLMVAKEAEVLSTALTATNLLAQVEVALKTAPIFNPDLEVALQ